MKYCTGPFLELNFYFHDVPEHIAFRHFVNALIELGAEFTGEALAHIGPDADAPFGFPHDWPREIINNSDTRPVSVYMVNAGGLGTPEIEHVGYVGISRAAAESDRHPIGIDTDGKPFADDNRIRAESIGDKAYKRFLALVEATHPAYAAITLEHGLKCPADLRLSSSRHDFSDFFLDESYIGAENLMAILQLYGEAYVKEIGDGLYFSCNEYFNPQRIAVPDDPSRHAEVARIIALVDEQNSFHRAGT
jgi:hypothetical protein